MDDGNIQFRPILPNSLTNHGFEIKEGHLIHPASGAKYKITVSQGAKNFSGEQLSQGELIQLLESTFQILQDSNANFQNLDQVKVSHEGLQIGNNQPAIKGGTFDSQYQRILTISSRFFTQVNQEERNVQDQPNQLQSLPIDSVVHFEKEGSKAEEKPTVQYQSLVNFWDNAEQQNLIPAAGGYNLKAIRYGFELLNDNAIMHATTKEQFKEALQNYFSTNKNINPIDTFSFSIRETRDFLTGIKDVQFLNSWKDEIGKQLLFLEQIMQEIPGYLPFDG